MNTKECKISIVVSVYNEQVVLGKFLKELQEAITSVPEITPEYIFVDDGSTDNSGEILDNFAKKSKNVRTIHFSRNFGHEAAMIAGIDHSSGDAVICLDSDLQHPPTLIGAMTRKFLDGHEIVNMLRKENNDGGIIKGLTSRLFYALLNRLSPMRFEPNASDFFLISKRVADILRTNFRERARFLRGFIQIIGFKKASIEFVAPARAGGNSKYSYKILIMLSVTAIAGFSKFPLHLSVLTGILFSAISIIVGIFSIVMRFTKNPVSGYTTIVVMISFMFGIQLFLMGVIGEYIGFLIDEGKKRPIYIVDKIIECDDLDNKS